MREGFFFMIQQIVKRDGRMAPFEIDKITNAIFGAAQASGGQDHDMAQELAEQVEKTLEETAGTETPTVEQVQDTVEKVLIESGHARTAKKYILYRNERTRVREMNTRLMKVYEDLTFKSSLENDVKRENANIDGDTAMGTMLKYGSEGAKQFYEMFILDPAHAKAHREGDIHIHDLDFLTLTTTCCQIDLLKLFRDGFSTGHGFLREPNDIRSYSALACIAIQSNQNDQHGGQSVPNFDYSMAPGVRKTFRKLFRDNLAKALEVFGEDDNNEVDARALTERVEQETGKWACLAGGNGYDEAMAKALSETLDEKTVAKCMKFARKYADKETRKTTYQAMEALVHNLNTMHSRAGAQIPFSSLNYGTDTSPEGRLVMEQLLLATEAGLGNGETPIFPIHIFKVKEGVNYNEGDPNYDLFKLAMPRFREAHVPEFLVPRCAVQPAVLQARSSGDRGRLHGLPHARYVQCRATRPARLPTAAATCRSRRSTCRASQSAATAIWTGSSRISTARSTSSSTSCSTASASSAAKRVRNYPFLMGEGVWLDSEKLGPDDEVGEVLKHGTLTLGFIGLAECLKALIGSTSRRERRGAEPRS